MSHRMSEFTAIDPSYVVKMREAGIENTDDMMRLWADPSMREELMKEMEIDKEQLTRFVAMSRLARVKNVGPKYVEVLLAAGIDGPRSLFEFEPIALAKRLGEVMAEKNLKGPVPPLSEIEVWFTDVKSKHAAAV
jgi:uncharacterized protein DUF4332